MVNAYRKLPLTLAGLCLGVAAAIVAMFAAGRVLVTGPSNANDFFGNDTYDVDTGFIAFVVVLGLLIALAVGLPYLWARLAGIGLTAFLALTIVIAVIAARSDDELFAPKNDVSLDTGGVILVIAFLVAVAGLTLALVGSRELADDHYAHPPPPPALGPPMTAASSGWAVASLTLGIAGFLTFFTGALAIAFAALAFAEVRQNPGRGGRGLAVAGLVLGIVALSLYGLVMLLSALFAGPS